MLVLSRKVDEKIVIDGQIQITVLGTDGHSVRIGIDAPRDVTILRSELTKARVPASNAALSEADARREFAV